MSFAEDLAERYPDSARVFEEMAEEEEAIGTCCSKCTSGAWQAPAADPRENVKACAAGRSG
jgi:hypothetical protein